MSTQDNPRIKVGLSAARPAPDNIPIGNLYVSTDVPIMSVVIGPGTPHTWEEFAAGGIVAGVLNSIAKFTAINAVGSSQSTDDGVNTAINAAGAASVTGGTGATIQATTGSAAMSAPDPAGTATLSAGAPLVIPAPGVASVDGLNGVAVEAATGNVQLVAALGKIVLDAPGGVGADIEMTASGTALLNGETLTTVSANNGPVNVTALLDDITITSGGDVVLNAGGFVNLEGTLGVALKSEPPHLGSFAVAGLAGAPGVGWANAFATDARRINVFSPLTLEAPGSGTGSMVERNSAGVWHLPGTNVIAQGP